MVGGRVVWSRDVVEGHGILRGGGVVHLAVPFQPLEKFDLS